jgi:hypothetical protein
MKRFLSKLDLKIEFLKNYLLQFSIAKKILLSVGVIFVVIFICAKQYINKSDIKNVFNSQTIISAINIGNANNEIIFESNDKKVEVENNVNGQNESFVIIKDVGSKWKQKKLQAKVVGNGEVSIKLSGVQSVVPKEPIIFVQYQNFKINGQEVFEGIKEGRTDKDELIFKVPVKEGQILGVSIEYRNSINTFIILNEAFIAIKNNFAIFIFLLLFACIYLFNTENQARKVCKIWIWLLIIAGVYFIMLNPFFLRWYDEIIPIIPATAISKPFSFLEYWIINPAGRFSPFALIRFNLLTFLPYGHTSQAHYLINVLFYTISILLLEKILDFKSKQKVSHLYLKLFCSISLLFLAKDFLNIFANLIFYEGEITLGLLIFLFAYKKAMGGGGGANYIYIYPLKCLPI